MTSALLGIALCSGWLAVASASAVDLRPLAVSVSLPPQVWLVESIGGERVVVTALVGPGDSEETYAPTDAQVSATLRSQLFFRIGASFEEAPWFRALSAASGLEIVDLREGVERIPMNADLDPHLWTSPRRLVPQARTVAAALAAHDPASRDHYERRLEATTRELEILDREIADTLAPYRGRAFFVFHPTWGYFASDYGLRQIAIEVDGKQPTDRDLTRVLELARAERPRSLLVEPQVSGSGAKAVAAAMGARVVPVDSLAPDLPSNLRRFARSVVESFAGPSGFGAGGAP